MFRPHKASIRQPLIEITALHGLTRQYIYMLLLHVIVFENVRLHFPHAIFVLQRSHCVPLRVVFLGLMCVPYIQLPIICAL
jgi:hypothetical protein